MRLNPTIHNITTAQSSARRLRWALAMLLVGAFGGSALAESAFKLTFSAERRAHGRVWNGGVDDTERLRSMIGWHIHDDDRLRPPNRWDIVTQSVGGDVAAPGVILSLNGPDSVPFTFFTRLGETTFVPADVSYGVPYIPPGTGDEIVIERVPDPLVVSSGESEDDDPALLRTKSGEYWLAWVSYQTVQRDGDYLDGADRVLVSRSADGRIWSKPESVTAPGDHFRVALAEDGRGTVWCVYGLQRELGSGNFDIFATGWSGDAWSVPARISDDARPDAFHDVANSPDGGFYVVWAGFRDSPVGGPPQSDILLRRFDGNSWAETVNLTASAEDDWEPAVAVDSSGNAWVAWDSYREMGYDLMLRRVGPSNMDEPVAVSATPFAEMKADVAVDADDRVWVAWEEGAPNWGKDYGYQNPEHRINLKSGSRLYDPRTARRPRVAVFADGKWSQPAQPVTSATPEYLDQDLFQNPRLAIDGRGDVWILLRHQWRGAGRHGGHFFDFYATTWAGDAWTAPFLLSGSTGRQDTMVSTAPDEGDSLLAAVVGDGRRMPVGLPRRHDVAVMRVAGRSVPPADAAVALAPFQPSAAPDYRPTHADESGDIARIRGHRVEVGGVTWKVVRGDLHRHTEISMDGAVDGSLYDAYRYALNAAQLDFLGVSDHNYGQWLDTDEPEYPQSDNEFQFWRTQKSADLFHVPGRFTPLYGYERTPNFPLGHRNIFHATRGVFSLRVPKLHVRERPSLLDSDPPNLWAYLRRTGGIGIPHTPATTMGTDWKRRNDDVIPVTEIYQGDRNSYETQGGLRAALPASLGPGRAGAAPHQKGLVQNALGVGYRMGFIASSDHFSTHISYANLIVPDSVTTREDLLDAFRRRRTYASTDNIAVDFHAGGAHQGALIAAAQAPVLNVRVRGTGPILAVEVVKNNRVVFTHQGQGKSEARFEYKDADFADTSMGPTAVITDWSRPETGIRPRPNPRESFYYLRVIQSFSEEEPTREGEVAWSSPIFVETE